MFLAKPVGFLNSARDKISLALSSTFSVFLMTEFPPKITGPDRLDFIDIPDLTDLLSYLDLDLYLSDES